MSKEMPDVVFIKVDVDECEDVASDYNISCMPTFLYLKNGDKVKHILDSIKYFCTFLLLQVAEFSGANETQLRALIEQHK